MIHRPFAIVKCCWNKMKRVSFALFTDKESGPSAYPNLKLGDKNGNHSLENELETEEKPSLLLDPPEDLVINDHLSGGSDNHSTETEPENEGKASLLPGSRERVEGHDSGDHGLERERREDDGKLTQITGFSTAITTACDARTIRDDTGIHSSLECVKPIDGPEEGWPLNNNDATLNPALSISTSYCSTPEPKAPLEQSTQNEVEDLEGVERLSLEYKAEQENDDVIEDEDSDVRLAGTGYFPDDGPSMFSGPMEPVPAPMLDEMAVDSTPAMSTLKQTKSSPISDFRRYSSHREEPAAWLSAKQEYLKLMITSEFLDDTHRFECALRVASHTLFPYLGLKLVTCATVPDLADLAASLDVWKYKDVLTTLCKFKEIFSAVTDLRQKFKLGDAVGIDIDEMCIRLYQVLTDVKQYERFLNLRDDNARSLLYLLQTLLDLPKLDGIFRALFVDALLQLSKASGLYPTAFVRRYEVLVEGNDTVPAGRFGNVWKGRYQGQDVAVKVLKMLVNSDNTTKFKALVWRQLRHPNVLPLLCLQHVYYENQFRIGLVSPWMVNGNIQQFLRAAPSLRRDSLILDIAEGLEYLHSMEPSIVHGDLKAVNVLVTDTHQACLVDFGLSTASSSCGLRLSSFSSGVVVGTPRWMAPELLDGTQMQSTESSDVFSFGCVCYEMFSGTVPYPTRSDNAVIFNVPKGRRPPRPSHYSPQDILCETIGLDDELWILIEWCWEKSPQQRPSMSSVLKWLPSRAELAGLPESLSPAA